MRKNLGYVSWGLLFMLCSALSGCNAESNELEANRNEASISPVTKKVPFLVSMDKTSVESKQKETVTVDIITELEDWDYRAEAKNGKIQNKTAAAFDYTSPGKGKEDILTIHFYNNGTGEVYEYSIPLIFAGNSKE